MPDPAFMGKTAIWWIRRDLRLRDNDALSAAVDAADRVLPVFIKDPPLMHAAGEPRCNFLFSALHALDQQIRLLGGQILVRTGEPLAVLLELSHLLAGAEIFAQEDVSPYARERDARIKKQLPFHLCSGVTAIPPSLVLKLNGEPFKVFTAFSKAWKNLPQPAANFQVPTIHWDGVEGLGGEKIPLIGPLLDGSNEENALQQLKSFTAEGVYHYAEQRNRVDLNGTSNLSTAFHFGLISGSQAVTMVRNAQDLAQDEGERASCETWLNEVIWREFYASILYHFPFVRKTAFRPQYRHLEWRDDSESLHAWQRGETGYPIVDAAVRQLLATGWMHNRARMITASFLVKDLLINWQDGEEFFLHHLSDGDIASNNGGWQWTAGVGTDAAPYFRIFNPVSQGQKHDPQGEYIRRWLPEVAMLPRELVHEPWKISPLTAKQYGFRMGGDYPMPIIDHAEARKRVLEVFGKGRVSL